MNIEDIDLRDWFAGQALAGMLANSQFPQQSSGEPYDQFAAKITDRAYRLADAMVKEGLRYKKATASS